MFERSILQRISTALGAGVVAERFSISALTGAIDCRGVSISGMNWSARIERITGQFAVTRALSREIVIQSLQIDRLVLHVNASIQPSLPRPDDRWRLRIARAIVTDSEIHIAIGHNGSARHIEFTNVSGNLIEQHESVCSQWIVESSRDDKQILVSASIGSIADLTRIADGALRLRASVGDSVRCDIYKPRLGDAIAGFRLGEALARNGVAGAAQVVAR